jgi:hypothetical protein
MTTLEKITAKMEAETAGMTADERFHFYRQRDIAAAAKAGLSLRAYQLQGVAA